MSDKAYLKAFLKTVLDTFSDLMSKHGFKKESKKLVIHGCIVTYKNGERYIQVEVNVHPHDYPYYWNILLGEGSLEWPEYDWNHIALWHIKNYFNEGDGSEYKIDLDKTTIRKTILVGKRDLEKYGEDFLKRDLKLFYKLRSKMNKERDPYKIYFPNKDGTYSMTLDEESKRLKEKFS